MTAPLYTVGYEGRSLDDLLAALVAANVGRLVDVRELPLSRRKGFSKTALSQSLATAGIEYVHMRALGNPKPNRERYWSGATEEGARIYRERIDGEARPALLHLADSLDGEASCLLCFERDHAVCHRDVIVDALRGLMPDLSVKHL